MALKCGLVIYNRPCREDKPRVYTACDVARIATYAAKNTPREVILATVAKALNYETVLDGKNLSQESIQDSALSILKAAGTIEDILGEIPVISKLGFLISTIVQFAGSVAFIIGYVAAKIISGREITGAADCSSKRRK